MKSNVFQIDGSPVEVPAGCEHLIRAKYRKEVADEYGLSERVFRRRVKNLDLDTGPRGYMDEAHVLRIYLEMGWPCRISE